MAPVPPPMPRHPTRQAVRKLLADLTPTNAPQREASIVAALVADALLADRPLMSLGATLRHRAQHLPTSLRDRLRDAAQAELTRRAGAAREAPPPATITGEWLPVREAAPRLGVTENTLRERLRQPEHRRRLGWPMWDGHQWWVAEAAVDPARRAAFVAGQPEREPLTELLPASCFVESCAPVGEKARSTAAPASAAGLTREAA